MWPESLYPECKPNQLKFLSPQNKTSNLACLESTWFYVLTTLETAYKKYTHCREVKFKILVFYREHQCCPETHLQQHEIDYYAMSKPPGCTQAR